MGTPDKFLQRGRSGKVFSLIWMFPPKHQEFFCMALFQLEVLDHDGIFFIRTFGCHYRNLLWRIYNSQSCLYINIPGPKLTFWSRTFLVVFSRCIWYIYIVCSDLLIWKNGFYFLNYSQESACTYSNQSD